MGVRAPEAHRGVCLVRHCYKRQVCIVQDDLLDDCCNLDLIFLNLLRLFLPFVRSLLQLLSRSCLLCLRLLLTSLLRPPVLIQPTLQLC